MSAPRYPVPLSPPKYEPGRPARAGKRSLYPLIDAIFVALALGIALWLGWLLLAYGSRMSLMGAVYIALFYLLVAYLVLPRLHQTLTWIYVPQYFIARTRTGEGILGDPVNLALNGSADDIHAAMQGAGWVKADDLTIRSAWKMATAALTRSSYPAAPVSDLYLLGERHDFAYQQEVDGSVSERHHVRFWEVPDGWILPGGKSVEWLAAGTYDRSVGFSLFTMQITHKIDADTDKERDYIIGTLRHADPEVRVEVIEDFSTSYHSHNGGGDAITTDGDLPVLNVAGAAGRLEGYQPPPDPGRPGRVAADRHLPPGTLLLSAVLFGLTSVYLLAGGLLTWMGIAHLHFWGETLASFDKLLGGASLLALGALGLTIVVRTIMRGRLARVALMALAALNAALALHIIASEGREALRFVDVMLATVSVIMLLGLTSPATRRWVSANR